MGIQDFNPEVQKIIRRIQPYEQTKATFDLCRQLAFESINIDLIYGLPLQTPESFLDSVDKVIGLGPDRVAMFSYAHVPWLKKQQGAIARYVPQGMDKFQIFRAGIERFTGAGYLYIGMDHFARPGRRAVRRPEQPDAAPEFPGLYDESRSRSARARSELDQRHRPDLCAESTGFERLRRRD